MNNETFEPQIALPNLATGKIAEYYRLGLDIGIASVGWACLACDKEGNVKHILDLGVRTFDPPETDKGKSNAVPRREKRSLRRRTRRRALRMARARELLGIEKEQPDDYKDVKNRADVYELRARALDRLISEKEFAAVLMLLIKRRGYQSNGKRSDDKDEGKVKDALRRNELRMSDCGYRTVGEMFYKSAREENGRRIYEVRNHIDYEHCISRELLREEIKILFEKQREYGNRLASEKTERDFLEFFSAQRNFDEGPGKGSKYSAALKVGKCPFETDEKRAAKATYSFEYFRVLQSLNNLRIASGGAIRKLSEQERKKALEFCLYREAVKYSDLRKKLDLKENEFFDALQYRVKQSKKENKNNGEPEDIIAKTEKAKFCGMPASGKIRKVLSDENCSNVELLDMLGEILTYNKSEDRILAEFEKSDVCNNLLSSEERKTLTSLSFSGFGHVGLTVVRKVIPFLEEGLVYSDAMNKAGYNHANPNEEIPKGFLIDVNAPDYREELSDITSPAVRRAVSQSVKVVNSVIRKYGSPIAIHIELARELGKTKEERDKIKKDNDSRWEDNEKKLCEIRDKFNIAHPTGRHLVKYRLYEEQGGKCVYSGKELDLGRVMNDDKYAEVDHIIPYSRSFCDAQYNKVLVLSEENQKKGNGLPKEYLGNGEKWEEFCVRVQSIYNRNVKKREALLREKFTVEDGKAWKERTLNDTKYISRFMYNLLRNRLLFADSATERKKKVVAVNGIVTSYARKLWGIQKIREDGDLHHAADAVVIACVGDAFIQSLTKWAKGREFRYAFVGGKVIDRETGAVLTPEQMQDDCPKRLPMPHEDFSRELECRLSENPALYENQYFQYGYDSEAVRLVHKVFVSRMPERKAKGAIHLETIYSYDDEADTATLKTALTKLKLKDGEIENYNEQAKKSDALLYEALKRRLKEFDGNGEKAFAEPFYKPKADGTRGPLVKKVLINQKSSAPVSLTRGRACNDRMVRVDVFSRNGKFYGVPVYVADVYNGVLPNKAVSNKPENEWPEMTEEYVYRFSLYKNDLVRIKSKGGLKFKPANKDSKDIELGETFAYYKGFDRSTGAIGIILHDNSFSSRGVGIQRLEAFEKWEVDLLGEIHKVTQTKRPPAQMKKR